FPPPRPLLPAGYRRDADLCAGEPVVSETLAGQSASLATGARRATALRCLTALGRGTRERCHFTLMILAVGWGVVWNVARPISWRRPVRSEFRRSLHQAIAGGLSTTLVTAGLAGLGMVYQALYWLGIAGQSGIVGAVLVVILLRSVAPLLVGFILL